MLGEPAPISYAIPRSKRLYLPHCPECNARIGISWFSCGLRYYLGIYEDFTIMTQTQPCATAAQILPPLTHIEGC